MPAAAPVPTAEPSPGDDAIGRRQVRGPGQIELPLGEAPCACVGVLRRVEARAVDLDQPAADHRIQRRRGARRRLQRGAHAVDLFGKHVDDEVIRRIGREARPPVLHQIAAHDGQQQERHQPQCQSADLQARRERPATQVRETEAPGHAALRQSLQQHDQQPGRERRDREQRTDAADHDRPGRRVLCLPRDQERDDARSQPVGNDTAGPRPRKIAAQHAQRRHAGERNQWRQREAEQEQHAGAERGNRRKRARRWQLGHRDRRQQQHKQLLPRERERDARGARNQTERAELQDEQRERLPPRRAEAAEHRCGVEMAAQVTRRGERDGDGGQDHRNQRRQAQEFLRAFERLPDLGPQVADVLHSLARLQFRLQPIEIRAQRVARREIGDEEAIGGAIAGLQEVRRGNVVDVDEKPRRDRQQAAGNLRLLLDDRADTKRRVANGNRVAALDAEPGSEARVGPCFAPRRNPLRRRAAHVGGIDQQNRTAQRITRSDRLHVGQHRAAGGRIGAVTLHHAVELERRGGHEAAPRRFARERWRQRPVAGDQHIGAEQQVCLARERPLHAIREKPDGANARDREHHRRDQHRELARAPVARQHPEREAERAHRLSVTPRRARRRRAGRRRATTAARSGKRDPRRG